MASILIVDDEHAVRGPLGRVLHGAGHEVVFAESVADAWSLLGRREFHVVLSDINMPGESGLELARRMEREYPDVALVMVTGVDDPEVAAAAMAHGACGYVIKPFSPNVMLITVCNALRWRALELDNRRYRTELEELMLRRVVEQPSFAARQGS